MLFNNLVAPSWLAVLSISIVAITSTASGQTIDADTLYVEQERGKVAADYSTDEIKQTFPLHDIVTVTPWTKDGKPTHFRGPLLSDVLIKSRLNSVKSIEVYAYNDFISEVKSDEIARFSPVLAMEQKCTDFDRQTAVCAKKQDFRALTVKDGGPYYIVWPMEKLPGFYIPTRNSIWVWFVKTLRPAL